MKYVSINASKTSGFGTIRPKDKPDYDWGTHALNDLKFRDYCNLDPFTDTGLDKIATYNGYSKEWERMKESFDGKTAHVEKRWQSWKLYASTRARRKYHLEPLEGGHRRAAAIQAVFCAEIDAEDGTISGPNTLRVESFNEVGINTEEGYSVTDDDIVGAAVAVTTGGLDSGFFSEPTRIELRWSTNWDVTVPIFLEAARGVSLNEAKNKRTSATKDPFAEIGILASDFLSSTADEALMNRPNLEKHVYPGGNKFPAKIGAKDIKPALQAFRNDLRQAVPLYDFPYSDIFENYCCDPFNEEHKKEFIAALTCEAFKGNSSEIAQDGEGKPLQLEPPFLVTWTAMAVDFGLGEKEQRISAEMANKLVVLPPILHILFAHQNNMTREETAANTELQNMIKYLLRHHVHNFGVTALHGHHVMKYGYGLNMHENLASSPSLAILPASIFIAETFNAALSNIVVRDSETINVRRKRLEEETAIVCDMYYTMNKYSGYLGFPTIIRTLGKKFFFTICKKKIVQNVYKLKN